MYKKGLFFTLVLILLTIIAIYAFRIGGLQNRFLTNLIYLLPPLLAVISGLLAVYNYGPQNPHGRSLLLISLGLFAWFIGELIWYVLRIVQNVEPFPSIADGFYLLGYPLLFAGLVNETAQHRLNLASTNKFTIAVTVFFSLLTVFVVSYFGVYRAYSPDQDLISNLISISYGLGDLILIVPSLLILKIAVDFAEGKLFWPWLSIFLGLVLTLIADILFALYPQQYQNILYPYNLIDLFWIAAYFSFTYGFFSISSALKETLDDLFYDSAPENTASSNSGNHQPS